MLMHVPLQVPLNSSGLLFLSGSCARQCSLPTNRPAVLGVGIRDVVHGLHFDWAAPGARFVWDVRDRGAEWLRCYSARGRPVPAT
jgi:hypothetical protein